MSMINKSDAVLIEDLRRDAAIWFKNTSLNDLEELIKCNASLHATVEELQAALESENLVADTLRAAINYALDMRADDAAVIWLRDWNEGEPEAMAELDAALAKSKGQG